MFKFRKYTCIIKLDLPINVLSINDMKTDEGPLSKAKMFK